MAGKKSGKSGFRMVSHDKCRVILLGLRVGYLTHILSDHSFLWPTDLLRVYASNRNRGGPLGLAIGFHIGPSPWSLGSFLSFQLPTLFPTLTIPIFCYSVIPLLRMAFPPDGFYSYSHCYSVNAAHKIERYWVGKCLCKAENLRLLSLHLQLQTLLAKPPSHALPWWRN